MHLCNKFQEISSLLEEDADSDSFMVDNVKPAHIVNLCSLNGDFDGLEVHSARFLETDQNCLVGGDNLHVSVRFCCTMNLF